MFGWLYEQKWDVAVRERARQQRQQEEAAARKQGERHEQYKAAAGERARQQGEVRPGISGWAQINGAEERQKAAARGENFLSLALSQQGVLR